MENRTIGEIVLALGFVIFGAMVLMADKAYTCDANGLAMNCDSLSQYYGLPNGKCHNSEYGNKLCRSGWDKLAIAEASPVSLEPASPEGIKVIANGGVFSCDVADDKFVNAYTRCKKDDGKDGYLGELI